MNKKWVSVERTRQSMLKYLRERDKPYYMKYDMRSMELMRLSGRTLQSIAIEFGVSAPTVRNLLIKWWKEENRIRLTN